MPPLLLSSTSRIFRIAPLLAQTVLAQDYLDILCTLATCDLTLAQLNYLPWLPGNALYGAIFAGCFAVQLLLGVHYRTWGIMIAAVRIFLTSFSLI
jgi:hypothetical protein